VVIQRREVLKKTPLEKVQTPMQITGVWKFSLDLIRSRLQFPGGSQISGVFVTSRVEKDTF
jgi:hypothetical protein